MNQSTSILQLFPMMILSFLQQQHAAVHGMQSNPLLAPGPGNQSQRAAVCGVQSQQAALKVAGCKGDLGENEE